MLASPSSISHIVYTDTQFGSNKQADVSFRGNTNIIPASTATDTVEGPALAWTVTSNPTYGVLAPWHRVEITPMSHVLHVDDFGGTSDEYATSPVFTVDGSGSLNVQFDHSWQFEFGRQREL